MLEGTLQAAWFGLWGSAFGTLDFPLRATSTSFSNRVWCNRCLPKLLPNTPSRGGGGELGDGFLGLGGPRRPQPSCQPGWRWLAETGLELELHILHPR